jgi:hypothetical protein
MLARPQPRFRSRLPLHRSADRPGHSAAASAGPEAACRASGLWAGGHWNWHAKAVLMPALVLQRLDLEPVSGIAALGCWFLHDAQVTDSSSQLSHSQRPRANHHGAQKASPSPFVVNLGDPIHPQFLRHPLSFAPQRSPQLLAVRLPFPGIDVTQDRHSIAVLPLHKPTHIAVVVCF